jgi:uncharacterized protein (TIGR00369 family)
VNHAVDPDQGEVMLAQVMLPEDANPSGNVHGGTLMKLADTAGGICAIRHARRLAVTAVMDSMTFERPVYVGDLVVLRACLTWTGHTSLETEITIDAERVLTGEVRRVSTAYFVYVTIDEQGRPTPVRPFEPSTPDQQRRWRDAEARRAVRLARRVPAGA